MAVTQQILASWWRPRRVMAGLLAAGPREDRALATLMVACGLIFVAQWPVLARAAHLDPAVPLPARLGGALVGTVFLLPLLAYGVAALSHGILRLIGRPGLAWGARLALFWSLLVVAPLMLLHGLVAGMVGPGPGTAGLGVLVLIGFLFQWGNALLVVARHHEAPAPKAAGM